MARPIPELAPVTTARWPWPGSEEIDASVALAVRFGFDAPERLARTLDAIDARLGSAPFHHRLTAMRDEEGCSLTSSFWIAEARALLGQTDRARTAFTALLESLDQEGVSSEMIDPDTGEWLGNPPQGLTNLGLVECAVALSDCDGDGEAGNGPEGRPPFRVRRFRRRPSRRRPLRRCSCLPGKPAGHRRARSRPAGRDGRIRSARRTS
jgi:GH15 family glucan-1,4-alpha-glucosidase